MSSPTTCLSAGAERGVCILRNITGDSSRFSALLLPLLLLLLLQCCPAPTGAAVLLPIGQEEEEERGVSRV